MARILVIDDSIFARLKICNILKAIGHDTVEAVDGRDGLQKAMTERPDCIFTDLLMPELDGIGLLAALQEAGLDLPVVVLTADIQETKRAQCLELGAVDFIHKPPQGRELARAMEKVLGSGWRGASQC